MRHPLFSRAAGLGELFALAAAERCEAEATALRRRLHVDDVPLHPAELIPFQLKNHLYNEAALRIGDPLLGLRVGRAAAEQSYNPLLALGLAGGSLQQAVVRTGDIMAWQCNVCCTRLRRCGDRMRWSLEYPVRPDDPVVHHAAAPLYIMLQVLLHHGGDASMVEVEFEGLPVGERRRAEALLGAAVQPMAGVYAITFPARWLEPADDPGWDVVAPPPDYAARPLPHSLTDAVRSVFGRQRDGFEYDLDQVSSLLGTSRRTLENGLAREGTCYRELLRQARVAHACRMLAESDAPIAEIAINSGYSDQANFHRAFIGVIGQTPGRYRLTRRAA